MTRVQKNKKKYYKKNKKIWKELLKIILCLIVGLSYTAYKFIKFINDMIAKLFMKLPRICKVGIIYLLVTIAIYGNINSKIIVKEVVKEEEIKIKLDKSDFIKDKVKENTNTTKLVSETCHIGEIECKIYNKSIEYGLSREQAFMVVSISRHETGKWTSKAFLEKHNLGGIMCSTGLKQYDSLDDGVDAFVSLLKNRYFDKGLDSIEKIQPVYCPIGASNDPKGLNQYWLPTVTKYYNEYINEFN